MRKLNLLILSIVAACGLLATPLAAPVFANDFNAACNGQSTGAFCSGSGGTTDPLVGTNGLIIKVTRVIAILAGVAAVIIMIIGGMTYVLSAGDAGKVTQAKNTIIYAAVGLVVIAAGQSIIAFVVGKL